jgi:tRNA(Ile)-lysidine synthase TilS/MesJ
VPFDAIIEEIKDQYLADERVWVVGFSGGKDSTLRLRRNLLTHT